MDRDAEIRRTREGVSMILEGLDSGRMSVITDWREYQEYLRAGRVVGFYLTLGQNVPGPAGDAYVTACERLAGKLRDEGLFTIG